MKNKLSWKLSLLGFFLPIFGVLIPAMYGDKDTIRGRSIRRGSAISTLIIFLAFMGFMMYYFIQTGMNK